MASTMPDFQKDDEDVASLMQDFLKVDLRMIETLAKNAQFYKKTVSSEYLLALKAAIARGCRNIRQHLKYAVVPVSSRVQSEVMARVQKVEEDLSKLWPWQPSPLSTRKRRKFTAISRIRAHKPNEKM
jgi:hypothetical protein